MIYLIYGEASLITKEIDNILVKEKDYDLIKYDLVDVSIAKVIEDLNTIDLFGHKKIIVVSNLSNIDNEDALIQYLNHKNDNILILLNDTVDNRKNLIKEIVKKATVIDTSNTNLDDYIKKSLVGYTVSNLTISLLKDYCGNNFYRIDNEINKLRMLKLEEKEITVDDVKLVVKKSLDKNVFDLTDAINRKDKKRIFNIYYELLEMGEDQIKLLAILANNFRTIYKVKVLMKNHSDQECLDLLSIKNPYRLKILKQETYKYSENELLNYLKNLSNMDIAIKSGAMDKKIGMELFLSKL